MNYKEIYDDILKDYQDKYFIILNYQSDTSCCYYEAKIILICEQQYLNPDNFFTFTLLHEIGHAETNTNLMSRTEQEFLATQWAIDTMGLYGFVPSSVTRNAYQDFIWDWCKKEYPNQKNKIKEFTLQW